MKYLVLILALIMALTIASGIIIGLIYLDPLTVLYTSIIWLVGLPITIYLFAYVYYESTNK